MGKRAAGWFSRNVGQEELLIAAGLGLFFAAGAVLDSAWVGLVVPGAVLTLLGLAPLRRLV